MTTNQNDVIEVSARCEFNGTEDVINVFEWQLTTPGPLTDAATVNDLEAITEDFYTLFLAFQSDSLLYRDLRFRNKTQDTVLGTYPWPTLIDGLVDGTDLPPGNCGVLNFNTTVARVTPRKFLGGLTTISLDTDGSLEATTVAQMALLIEYLLLIQDEAGGDWRYGVLSEKTSQFEFPVSGTATDISGYQRRRKQGRGS